MAKQMTETRTKDGDTPAVSRDEPGKRKGLKVLGGSHSDDWNLMLAKQALGTL